jgi:hypothetical protein
MRVLTERRALGNILQNRGETLVEHADKVEILHDNDMYSFPYANMCKSNSDKRTE